VKDKFVLHAITYGEMMVVAVENALHLVNLLFSTVVPLGAEQNQMVTAGAMIFVKDMETAVLIINFTAKVLKLVPVHVEEKQMDLIAGAIAFVSGMVTAVPIMKTYVVPEDNLKKNLPEVVHDNLKKKLLEVARDNLRKNLPEVMHDNLKKTLLEVVHDN